MIYGSAGLAGLAGWRLLRRTEVTQTDLLGREASVRREQQAFTDKMAAKPTAQGLVDDYRSLKVALTAFGLEADLPNRAFIRKVLESDLTDSKSLANRLSDKRYRAFAATFQFGQDTRPSDASIAARVSALYVTREFERRVGEADQTMRLALNARRELGALATRSATETTKWYEILGNTALSRVVKAGLGLPESLGKAPVDAQVAAMSQAASQRLGISGPDGLADPAKLDRLIDSYVARAGTAQATPYNAALTILSTLRR